MFITSLLLANTSLPNLAPFNFVTLWRSHTKTVTERQKRVGINPVDIIRPKMQYNVTVTVSTSYIWRNSTALSTLKWPLPWFPFSLIFPLYSFNHNVLFFSIVSQLFVVFVCWFVCLFCIVFNFEVAKRIQKCSFYIVYILLSIQPHTRTLKELC